MRAISGRDLARALERRGWTLLRVHGSHHYYAAPGGHPRVSIPIHGSKDLKPGLVRAILKDAGLTEADL
jgi:predicted RNA binding protein YcfA (HicA-like mRNA interferase family)